MDGMPVSRNLKPIRNLFVQKTLNGFNGFDGELIVGEPAIGNVLNRTQSGVMSVEGEPDYTYWVFDNYQASSGFKHRIANLTSLIHDMEHPRIKALPHFSVHNLESFLEYEAMFLEYGYEGIAIRHPDRAYKHGRSTLKEGGLIKFKRFTDSEGVVVDVLEGVVNDNPVVFDAMGATKRSMHRHGMRPSGQVGTIIVKDCETQAEIQVSPGRMTHEMRQFYWYAPDKLKGKIIKYKWFDYGVLDRPRFATFQAIRDVADMEAP
jgi:DNA ligase-1